ncbi:MAG: hypothetical protein WD227_11155 [Vicinamibacterales bacterium]
MVVKSIGVVSVGKMYGAITAAMGLLFGIGIALFSVLGAGLADTTESAILGPVLGVGAVIVLPIFYGVLGFIGGVIGAALYNLFAAMVGGVEIQTE